ncbi:uncharacterized protein [Physcomitrium patens]|uniref:uncharacterized protein isoform X3 n=1 Tax=Physcomitrium patens TaxID=3218 RepID=UPI003CCD252F
MCLTECLAASCCLCQSCTGSCRMAARYMYGLLFLLSNILAWIVRDYSLKKYHLFHYLKGCRSSLDCVGSDGVLRLSFGCFMFFSFMFLTTVGTSSTKDPRDSWHSGWWPIKTLGWAALMVMPFLIPPHYIAIYGEIARFGAGIFLVIQLVSFINFIYFWNEEWLNEKYEHIWRVPMILVSAVCFMASLFTIGVMIAWFVTSKDCKLNVFFISSTLCLVLFTTLLSVNSKVNAGLLTSGLMAVYIVFLCWSAIMSEPLSSTCRIHPHPSGGKYDWLTIVEFVVGFGAISLATFTTGVHFRSFSLPLKAAGADEGQVQYCYGVFHFVFAIGAMYFAMLLVGWSSHHTIHKWSIDMGWTGVWVKIANEWLAAGVYESPFNENS